MVTDFVKSYAQLIVSHPESIQVELSEIGENFYEITISCEEEDLGKIIGKSGNMINALKTIVNGLHVTTTTNVNNTTLNKGSGAILYFDMNASLSTVTLF
jgi:predicted RNA-binding protein YlqC (UPF0109 family)